MLSDPRWVILLVFLILVFLIPVIVAVTLICTVPGPKCTNYEIVSGSYRFHIDNYSTDGNSITFKDGSANITLVGDYIIYTNNCSK